MDALKLQNSLDFDDLIYYTVKLFDEHPEVAHFYSRKYSLILVDEYQDTNPAQFKMLRALTSMHQNLTVVGDDDQSIYSWRGADHSLILQFKNQFAGAHVVTLDQNYRSTTAILDAANQVIQKNKHRHPKLLWSNKGEGQPLEMILVEDDRAESEWVAEEILRRVTAESRRYDDFAILYRSNTQARIFEEALRIRQIPYKIVGTMSFMDRKEIKDLISLWRSILNPKDDPAVRRILNWPARGISPTVIEKAQTIAVTESCSFFEALQKLPQSQEFESLRPKAREGVLAFVGAIERERALLLETPATCEALSLWARDLLSRWGAKQAIDDDSEDAVQFQKKFENIEELCNSLGMIPLEEDDLEPESRADAILRIYLQRVLLDALEEEERDQEQKEKEQKNQVTLLTLHGSKGLEYELVFLVGLEEGLLPHQRTLDEATDLSEERRLCYVGMTRAKSHLILTRAKNRIRYGKKVPRNPSRFLDEIPREMMIVQDESLIPEPTSKAQEEAHEAKVKNFLAGIRANLGAK